MKRFHVLAGASALFCCVWISSFLGVIETALAGTALASSTGSVVDAVQLAPFYILVSFGCYALLTIGLKLFNFNDCEEAAVGLTEVRARLCGRSRARTLWQSDLTSPAPSSHLLRPPGRQ
jgi:hypothetical protein